MQRSQMGRSSSRRTGGGGSGSGNVSQITSVDGSVTINPATGTGVVDLSVPGLDTSETVASAAGAVWDGVTVSGTATVTGGTNITNTAGFNSFVYERPTVTAASALTVTYSATVAIEGAPVAAGSATITNPFALWVQSGVTRIDGRMVIGATTIPAVIPPPAGSIQLWIEYSNNNPSSPGLVLNATNGTNGVPVIELRNNNATVTKWWCDTNGDAYVEAANDYAIKVDYDAAIKNAFRITAAGIVLIGPQTSASFVSGYTDGVQVQAQAGGVTAHLAMGRQVAAHDANNTALVGVFNGTDLIAETQVITDGAVDAGKYIIAVKETGVAGVAGAVVVMSTKKVGIGSATAPDEALHVREVSANTRVAVKLSTATRNATIAVSNTSGIVNMVPNSLALGFLWTSVEDTPTNAQKLASMNSTSFVYTGATSTALFTVATAGFAVFDGMSSGFAVQGSSTGEVAFSFRNLNTANANAHACLFVSAAASTSGDAKLSCIVPGVSAWTLGVDNDDSDRFKLTSDLSSSLSASAVMAADRVSTLATNDVSAVELLFRLGGVNTLSRLKNGAAGTGPGGVGRALYID